MLQIILAVIGLTVVGALGLVTIQQFALQARIQDQNENIRRLDIAAESLAGSLGRIPGVDSQLAPMPQFVSGSYARLPAGIGSANETVSGVPFLYCPVAPQLTADERAGILANFATAPEPVAIPMPTTSYNVESFQGLVFGDNLTFSPPSGFSAPDRAGQRIVAFIVAAGTLGNAPIDCSSIYISNGRPAVNGGIVRAVSAPNASAGNSASTSVDFWISPTGNGPGTQAAPANVNTALEYFARYRPTQMTLNVIGTNTVSAATWSRFTFASTVSGSTLRIIGMPSSPTAPTINLEVANEWNIPANTVLQNVNIVGPTVLVGPGDTLTNSFSVGYATTTGTGSSVRVFPGGKFVSGRRTDGVSAVTMANSAAASNLVGIENRGEVNIDRGSISFGGNIAVGIFATTGSVTELTSASVGGSSRTSATPLVLENDVDLLASDSSTQILASSAGFCLAATNSQNPAVRWTGLVVNSGGGSQVGQRSAVVGEAGYPRPDPASDPAVLEAYQTDFNSRALARRVNMSDFVCQ